MVIQICSELFEPQKYINNFWGANNILCVIIYHLELIFEILYIDIFFIYK